MAKVSFSKLGLKRQNEEIEFPYNDEMIITIKQYLPIEEKLEMLARIINRADENSKFYNPAQLSVFFKLEVVQAYTNISFTEKQKEDFTKTFDLLEENGIIKMIMDRIPEYELNCLESWLIETTQAIYEYNSSAYGILNSLKKDYNNLDMDIEDLQKKVSDPETLELLKQIAPLLNLA